MKSYTLIIQPLTGVHIGTGNMISPMEYSISTINGKRRFVRYNTDHILSRLTNDPLSLGQFSKVCESNNQTEIRKFFLDHGDIEKDLASIGDCTDGFAHYYEKCIGKSRLDNSLEILEMYRPAGKMSSVIPGSSLKGSMRTALLNNYLHHLDDKTWINMSNNLKDNKDSYSNKLKNSGRLEKDIQETCFIMNTGKSYEPQNDLLRALLIGDVSFSAKGSQMVGSMKEIDLNETKDGITIPSKSTICAEILKGKLLESSVVGKCRVDINDDLLKRNGSKSFTIEDLKDACNYFFWREFFDLKGEDLKPEWEKFFYGSVEKGFALIHQLRQELERIKESKDSFMIRVGRWSQVEYVTVEKALRYPDAKKGYGKTRTLFDYNGQFVPLGWCECKIENTTKDV